MSRVNLENPEISNPIIKKGLKYGIMKMADADATLTVDTPPIISMTGTASRNITLPAATADMRGLTFIFVNSAAFTIVVKNASAATIATVPATVGATTIFVCLGDTALGVGGWSGGL